MNYSQLEATHLVGYLSSHIQRALVEYLLNITDCQDNFNTKLKIKTNWTIIKGRRDIDDEDNDNNYIDDDTNDNDDNKILDFV